MRHILCFHTKHNTPLLLLKELATKHVMFERLILKFNRNILGRNFTDRHELADICRFTAVHRFAQQHQWTTVNRKADHGWSTSARCIVPSWTSNISWTANHIFIKRGWASSGGSYLHKFQTQSVTLSWDCKCYFCKHLNQSLLQNHALQRFIRSVQRRWLE